MNDPEELRYIVAWLFGAPIMLLGIWIAVFNWYRHVEMARKRRAGIEQNISGTPFVGSVLFYLGWYIAPLTFTPWIFAFVLTEFGNVTFVGGDGEGEGEGEGPTGSE